MAAAESRYESPEALRRLQQVFDEVWAELVAGKSLHAAPKAAAASRDRLAVLVIKHMAAHDRDIENAKREIIAAFHAASN
jgi:hypothetical protein